MNVIKNEERHKFARILNGYFHGRTNELEELNPKFEIKGWEIEPFHTIKKIRIKESDGKRSRLIDCY